MSKGPYCKAAYAFSIDDVIVFYNDLTGILSRAVFEDLMQKPAPRRKETRMLRMGL